ncbi:MAG: hypothetical protein II571_10180 [Lachnospiraceae bacterium]|nr:hypothetical protein [Lachnospiraceae bacterium]
MATEEKKKKESLGIHSISFRIIAVVLICILVFTLLNVLYIIPKSKEAVQASTEKNMQDIATFSALLVQNDIDDTDTRTTPFIDVKMGYSPVDLSGFYASFSIGARFRIKDRHNLSVSTGIERQDADPSGTTDFFLRAGVDF